MFSFMTGLSFEKGSESSIEEDCCILVHVFSVDCMMIGRVVRWFGWMGILVIWYPRILYLCHLCLGFKL